MPRGRSTAVAVASGSTAALAVSVGALATAAGSGSAPECAGLSRCLEDPSGWVPAVHTYGAGLLLLLSLLTLVLVLRESPRPPRLLGLTVGATAVLVVMASFGGLLANGTLPLGVSSVQLVWLGLFVGLNLLVLIICIRSRFRETPDLRPGRRTARTTDPD